MKTRWFFILMVLPFMVAATPNKVEFFMGNLNAAKNLAAQEGKLYFAEFSASWCAPCRILEETTFTDPQVIDYISKNYIPVKIDIDDFDGIAMKQVYNVRTIPTIIVFNSFGQVLEKYEQSLPTSKMLELLKKHNLPENRVRSVSQSSATPQVAVSMNTMMESSIPVSNNSNNSPIVRESHSPMKASNTVSRPDKKPVTPIKVDPSPSPISNPSSRPSPAPNKAIPQGDGLYRFEVRHQASKGYSVQIGAFKEYGNVLREVARVQDDFDQPIIVNILRTGNHSVYKIMIGDFPKRHEAIAYQKQMKQQGLEGVIKDLSTMK